MPRKAQEQSGSGPSGPGGLSGPGRTRCGVVSNPLKKGGVTCQPMNSREWSRAQSAFLSRIKPELYALIRTLTTTTITPYHAAAPPIHTTAMV